MHHYHGFICFNTLNTSLSVIIFHLAHFTANMRESNKGLDYFTDYVHRFSQFDSIVVA